MASAMAVDTAEITLALEPHRRELTGYCYRMLGSGSEADDAVQETMVRAWRNAGTLKAPGALRAWLYRIATNVCLSMLTGAQRRARPLEVAPLVSADRPVLDELPRYTWVEPVADAAVMPESGDPATIAQARETLRLAFVAALQHLPPRQRAVLILREVLHFSAAEVAELLETTVASVNSALQRARSTLDGLDIDPAESASVAEEHAQLLDQYVDAFERYDVDALVALLSREVVFDMPPHAMWLQGPEDVAKWYVGPGAHCRGSRLMRVEANGQPAFAQYRPDPEGGWSPWSIVLIDVAPEGGKIGQIHNFLFPDLFPWFGLPEHLEA
jgi:RNA polymerase sigma-70 factor, ECF subfamily